MWKLGYWPRGYSIQAVEIPERENQGQQLSKKWYRHFSEPKDMWLQIEDTSKRPGQYIKHTHTHIFMKFCGIENTERIWRFLGEKNQVTYKELEMALNGN